MLTAKVSAKGQVTLPRVVRQALDVKAGVRVLFVVENETVLLRAIGPTGASALAGSLRRYAGKRKTPAEARSVLKKEVARATAPER